VIFPFLLRIPEREAYGANPDLLLYRRFESSGNARQYHFKVSETANQNDWRPEAWLH
jgi:hypothetical protein